jgi:hypothetical protein
MTASRLATPATGMPDTPTGDRATPDNVTFVGVRHHSPACAALVARTIEAQRPAFVLIEGPADVNDRLDELLLGHELPIAVYTSYRDETTVLRSWTPFCEYSPEWVALTTGHRLGATVRFIDLPAWHPAFAGRRNRYADAERHYTEVVDRLCRTFGVDNVDTLWDHLVEVAEPDGLAERLATYFDLIRGESPASPADREREAYMAAWVRAAVAAAGSRPVVVVTGGFHRPALMRLVADGTGPAEWPATPRFPDDAVGGSYLVPFSFRRLDAFDGYESGLPSPAYYQQVWEVGPKRAADALLEAVVGRLRQRGQPVSTADLIGARAMAEGLARLRGHPCPARTDVLDGLVSALVTEALDRPPPWTGRGRLPAGTDPVIVEMVAALSGSRVGRLHPDTPVPPLVPAALADLETCGTGDLRLDLTRERDRERSRILHRLRVLGIPGIELAGDPSPDGLAETWLVAPDDLTRPALIEAAGYGATLADAAAARLTEQASTDADIDQLAGVVLDAALCGLGELADQALDLVAAAVGSVVDLGSLGEALGVVLGLWRHDRVLGVARTAALGSVIAAAVVRLLWLVEGVHGGPSSADLARLNALVALRDAVRYAGSVLTIEAETALAVMRRLAGDPTRPPDLRGAAVGFAWSLGDAEMAGPAATRALRAVAAPGTLGDWLAGLFALAREEVLADEPTKGAGSPDAARDRGSADPSPATAPPDGGASLGAEASDTRDGGLLAVLDRIVSDLSERDFLVALPALRQAFTFFPPRERETIAEGLLARRGIVGSARALLRVAVAPELLAEARELEARVEERLREAGLVGGRPADGRTVGRG